MRLMKKIDDGIFFPLFLWYPPRITAQFSTSAFRSPRISAANKASITRYTLLLVYSLLYVLTISWCMLFHYASSLSLALSYPAIHSARSFPWQAMHTWHSTENRAKFAKARIEISLRSPVIPSSRSISRHPRDPGLSRIARPRSTFMRPRFERNALESFFNRILY